MRWSVCDERIVDICISPLRLYASTRLRQSPKPKSHQDSAVHNLKDADVQLDEMQFKITRDKGFGWHSHRYAEFVNRCGELWIKKSRNWRRFVS